MLSFSRSLKPITFLPQMLPKNNSTLLEMWTKLASTLATFMFIWAMLNQFIPYNLKTFIDKWITRFYSQFQPYISIKIPEHSGDRLKRNEAYKAVQSYLSSISSKSAKRFLGEMGADGKSVILSMDNNERVEDVFKGVKVWWVCGKFVNSTSVKGMISHNQNSELEKKYYKITFHQRHRELISGKYLSYVMKQGKEIQVKNRQRKLYTNVSSRYSYGNMWSHIPFKHPATFETLAMDSHKKQEIILDLEKFSKSKDYYARIGKAWKRGYLLFGPPGTGKSTLIAAMANLLKYDVFDLELTAVRDNTELRRLLIETTSKSIIVIEDIDCSLDLTGQRRKKNENNDNPKEIKDSENNNNQGEVRNSENEKKSGENSTSSSGGSKVTLSGLLNFIDGIWSSSGGERIIVFTTNYVEKLDPALIRRGRMDKHIELSYCSFEGFKVLAKNYLFIEEGVSYDDYCAIFDEIKELLSEVNITPADVAEILMPKSNEETTKICLEKLVNVLKEGKEEEKNKKAESLV